MDASKRALFNAAYSDELFAAFLHRFKAKVGPIPFHVAETPLFMTEALRHRLARYSSEIVAQLARPPVLADLRKAIPPRYDAPGMDPLPNCVQVDFALVEDGAGGIDGRLVELQAFPSLYALMKIQSDSWAETFDRLPGLEGDWSWAMTPDEKQAIELMRRTIVADEDPREVVLVDLEPENQKTLPDFEATRLLFGVESVCVSRLRKHGRELFRERDGKLVRVRRIYNRMVFDELEIKRASLPFRWTDELDVTWCSHPNWYWVWSKFSLPYLHHPAVPRTRLLSEVDDPGDLSTMVLKPLFSFAGSGVNVDVTPEDLARVPPEQREAWVLQDKIRYADALHMPDGAGVKAEVRVMLLRPPEADALVPLVCLVRLSRGKMLGVDYNKGLSWTGGTVGMWRR